MIYRTLNVSLILATIYFMLSAHLELTVESQNRQRGNAAAYALPDGATIRVAALNYKTAASDLIWINAVLFSADVQRTRRNLRQITDFTDAIIDLDPYFHPIYDLHNTTRIHLNLHVTEEDLAESNRVLKIGTEHFPRDWQLPLSIATNRIGFRHHHAAEERLHALQEVAYYAQRSAEVPGAPDYVLRLATRYQRRALRAEQGLPDHEDGNVTGSPEELNFLMRRYHHAADAQTRTFLLNRLAMLGAEQEILRQTHAYSEQFDQAHRRGKYYLSPDVFSLVAVQHYEHDPDQSL